MRKVAAAALTLGLLVGVGAAPSDAAGYKKFHPRAKVTAKQLGPNRIKFVNRTNHCVALTVTETRGSSFTRSTYRLYRTHQTDDLYLRAKVTRVTVYKPGC